MGNVLSDGSQLSQIQMYAVAFRFPISAAPEDE